MTAPADQALFERRKQVLGPGYAHFFDQPLHLVKGQGVWVWDAAGNKYLDCYNNVPSVGHCHPDVVAALSDQAATFNSHTRYLHENVVALAERLAAKLPGELGTSYIVCTGTEANDLAMQIARYCTGNYGAIVTEASYHGNSELVRLLSTDSYPVGERPDWLGVIEPPNLYRGPFGRDDESAGEHYAALADEAIEQLGARGHRPAALLLDSSWDSNGPLVAPNDYPQRLCARVREAGGLIIADEVQAGYCRTGQNWWGFQNYGVMPDIVTLGKPMGDGHPVAAVVTTPAIAAAFTERSGYFNTFGGNPVSAAVASEVIDVIDREALLDNARETGDYLGEGLVELMQRHRVIGDVQGSGLFWGLDLVADPDTRAPLTRAQVRHVNSLIAGLGVITGYSGRFGQILKLRPPLPFDRNNAEQAIEAIDRGLTRFESGS